MVFPYPTQGYVRLAGMPFHTKSAKVSPNGSTIRKHTHATWVALCMVVLLGFLCTHAAASQTAELFVQLGHTDAVWSVAWSPDGRSLASGSGDWTVKVWDVERGELLHTLRDSKIIKAPREVVGQGRCPQTTYPSGATA
jgi:WD40 repeat protein